MNFYRYRIQTYASIDSSGEYYYTSSHLTNTKLVLEVYSLVKETPKGYWISYGDSNFLSSYKRWISKTSRKRYAYPTKEEALNGFIKRTEKRIKILESHLDECKTGIYLANKEFKK